MRLKLTSRGPYEAIASMPEDDDDPALRDLAQFVADLLGERLVVAMQRGSIRGGRVFLKPEELTRERRCDLEWITSWRDTFDAGLSDG